MTGFRARNAINNYSVKWMSVLTLSSGVTIWQFPGVRPMLRTLYQHWVCCSESFTSCSRGFDLNVDKGKTGVVLTFQGKNAPQQRRSILLSEPSGFWCELSNGDTCWLHASATYRHLGTQFASKLNYTEELKHRIGQASSVFSAMKRPVLQGRPQLRLQKSYQFQVQKTNPKTSLLYLLVLIMTTFPFLLCWCKRSRVSKACNRGASRLGEAHASDAKRIGTRTKRGSWGLETI